MMSQSFIYGLQKSPNNVQQMTYENPVKKSYKIMNKSPNENLGWSNKTPGFSNELNEVIKNSE